MSLHGTGAWFPCQGHQEPPGPQASLPTMDLLAALLPHIPQQPVAKVEGGPSELSGGAVLSHKPCGSSGWEAAFSHPSISHTPHPGTIPMSRVLPAGRAGGSCVTVWLTLLFLFALAVIKGLVRSDTAAIWHLPSHILGRAGCFSAKDTSLWPSLLEPRQHLRPS